MRFQHSSFLVILGVLLVLGKAVPTQVERSPLGIAVRDDENSDDTDIGEHYFAGWRRTGPCLMGFNHSLTENVPNAPVVNYHTV